MSSDTTTTNTTLTTNEIKRLEAQLLPLKHRRLLEQVASRDPNASLSEFHYAMAWALLQLLDGQ